jgi:hypothetical protein
MKLVYVACLFVAALNSGCCIGPGGRELEIDSTVNPQEPTARVPLYEYKTTRRFGIHQFDCALVRSPEQKRKTLTYVEVPMAICHLNPPIRVWIWQDSFDHPTPDINLEVDGKMMMFSGFCHGYIDRPNSEPRYELLLRPTN